MVAWELRWLIERPVEGRAHPEYWDGSGWTDDPWKAQAFATKEDGERRINSDLHPFIPTIVTAKVVSHGFDVAS